MTIKSQDNCWRLHPITLFFLFFVSGFTGLVYEVLWLKELGLLFGNTAYAAATTLAVFFFGLSMGGYLWGKKAANLKNPLRTYAALEFGISISALLYFLILDVYYLIYTFLFRALGHHHLLLVGVKFGLATTLLFLPAFFMGGTLPVMGQYLIRRSDQLGKTASLLYAVNTAGAALGAFMAGFYLPVKLGFKNSYLMAIAFSTGIAVASYWISFSKKPDGSEANLSEPVGSGLKVSSRGGVASLLPEEPPLTNSQLIWYLAFLSGFITLSLEVLWTRMFAQVLHNSVYSFSAILVTFLISLALGSILANLLCYVKINPFLLLGMLLTLSGILVGSSSFIFYHLTNGLGYIAVEEGWTHYIRSVFKNAAIVMLLPGILMGGIFPYLIKMYQGMSKSAGKTIGQLASVNTFGAILGSLSAGFIFLSHIGLWASIRLMAVLYFLLAVFVIEKGEQLLFFKKRGFWKKHALPLRAFPFVGLILFVSFLDPSNLPLMKLNLEKMDSLHELWQGSHGVVAVVRRGEDLKIRLDNYYTLGGVASLEYEQRQAHIPLFIHPNPQSVFFIGLATGITAGAALYHPVQKVVTCELVPEVVTAARKYFSKYNNGLFTDGRSKIVIEDGRNYLLGTPDKYDVIISDLFVPWGAGTGSLYTKEHFQIVRSRLNQGGLFAQWLPLYQLSKNEFFIIAKTMLEVFPQVTLWRGDFFPTQPIVALIGQNEVAPLDTMSLFNNVGYLSLYKKISNRLIKAGPFLFYAGNLTQHKSLFKDYPVNTDDRPLIEYLAPITHRNEATKKVSWFTSFQLAQFYDELFTVVKPEEDPYLKNLTEQELDYVRAGLSLYKAYVHRQAKKLEEARVFLEDFLARVPPEMYVDDKEKE